MPFTPALSVEQKRRLVRDYVVDGNLVQDLATKYHVSTRTVERYLADAGVPRRQGPQRKRKNDRREKKPRVLKPCGTNAAYQRHKKRGEYPCALCLGAHTRDNKEYENATKR